MAAIGTEKTLPLVEALLPAADDEHEEDDVEDEDGDDVDDEEEDVEEEEEDPAPAVAEVPAAPIIGVSPLLDMADVVMTSSSRPPPLPRPERSPTSAPAARAKASRLPSPGMRWR